MNCRAATHLLAAERDAPLPASEQAGLERHLAACPECARVRVDLAAAADAWRQTTARVTPPSPAAEWRELRASLHAAPPPRRLPGWLVAAGGLPLAAAAAWGLLLALRPPAPATELALQPAAARAEFLETGDDASPVVFLDQTSGWLIVWAEAPAEPSSI